MADGYLNFCHGCEKQKREAKKAQRTVVEAKMCQSCRVTKLVVEYHKAIWTIDGYAKVCKSCTLENKALVQRHTLCRILSTSPLPPLPPLPT